MTNKEKKHGSGIGWAVIAASILYGHEGTETLTPHTKRSLLALR